MNSIKKARQKLREFSPRGSSCPICRRDFRYGCKHSVQEAKDKLKDDITRAIVRNELQKKRLH